MVYLASPLLSVVRLTGDGVRPNRVTERPETGSEFEERLTVKMVAVKAGEGFALEVRVVVVGAAVRVIGMVLQVEGA